MKRLFPSQDVPSLLPLSRQELLSLLERPVHNTPTALPSPPLHASPLSQELESPVCSGSEQGLTSLELMPGRNAEWDEERRGRDPIPIEADDVNALSLSVDRQSSYLGASSIKAALMCLLKVQPALRNSLTTPLHSVEVTHNFPTTRVRGTISKDTQRIPWSWKGQTLIDAYFKRIHVFVPMLDEASFRADYLEGQRFDAPWLALLNMVFAMGSVVAMKSDDYNHINYYNRAMEYLPVDAFGSSHIESVQALALIGGYYLHYINRPNMANAVLGAAIRMASALGLHRESLAQGSSDIAAAETRRRTWWSLFCLDTWATTTMGRPSFGRWGPAINIRPPEFGINQVSDRLSAVASVVKELTVVFVGPRLCSARRYSAPDREHQVLQDSHSDTRHVGNISFAAGRRSLQSGWSAGQLVWQSAMVVEDDRSLCRATVHGQVYYEVALSKPPHASPSTSPAQHCQQRRFLPSRRARC